MRTKFVLTMAAVMTLLVPSIARAVDVYGVLTNDSSAVQIDSVLWYLAGSVDPVPQVTPDWGGQAPMTDTFQFPPLEEWPFSVQLFYMVDSVPGEDTIEPVERNQLYPLPVPGSQVMFTDSFTGIAERPGLAAPAALRINPNPLTGGFATVRYSLPRAGLAALSVYDVTGRTALTRTLAAGRTGTASLDLRKLDAGVYILKVTTDCFTATQKLVVQR